MYCIFNRLQHSYESSEMTFKVNHLLKYYTHAYARPYIHTLKYAHTPIVSFLV